MTDPIDDLLAEVEKARINGLKEQVANLKADLERRRSTIQNALDLIASGRVQAGVDVLKGQAL